MVRSVCLCLFTLPGCWDTTALKISNYRPLLCASRSKPGKISLYAFRSDVTSNHAPLSGLRSACLCLHQLPLLDSFDRQRHPNRATTLVLPSLLFCTGSGPGKNLPPKHSLRKTACTPMQAPAFQTSEGSCLIFFQTSEGSFRTSGGSFQTSEGSFRTSGGSFQTSEGSCLISFQTSEDLFQTSEGSCLTSLQTSEDHFSNK
jgi:hypothetical protein